MDLRTKLEWSVRMALIGARNFAAAADERHDNDREHAPVGRRLKPTVKA